MDDRRWRRIDDLFAAALEMTGGSRAELLGRECGRDLRLRRAVERLLALEARAGRFLEEPVAGPLEPPSQASPADGDGPSDALRGVRIGPYRLLRPLGFGGMGSVYLARREDDYRQEVAIKLVRYSLMDREGRRRLRAERQVLARLEHANIARLYDGGTTEDGLPYLVMERVDGLPIDRYCDHHRLSVRHRLLLVRRVAEAVAHAHHHLCVHCDIKPSNILVTAAGVPKLLDFGVAKLLRPEKQAQIVATATGRRPMTLACASPEQILGQAITTATDIYAIGVLCSQLLCGRLPYSIHGDPEIALRRAILEQEPIPPSRQVTAEAAAVRGAGLKALRKQLRGDLDAIVMKASRKAPELRYKSAEAFAEDVTRALEARPVKARAGTWIYRAGRFLRRLTLPPDPRRRRERWSWAAAVLVLAGLSSTAMWLRPAPTACRDSAAQLAEVWSPARRAAAERAFYATALPFAADTWRRVAAAVDRYAGDWIATDEEICHATLVHGERSPRLLDLGRLCLDGRRQQLRALTDLMVRADASMVTEGVAAVSLLGDLHECVDQAELATRRLPPLDPAIRRRLEHARGVAEAQHLRFRLKEPVDAAALRRVEAEVRQLEDPQLLARILFALGLAELYRGGDADAGEAHLEQALAAAIAGGDRPQQASIYAALIRALATTRGDLDRARFWEPLATAALAALPTGYHEVEMEVFNALGVLEWEAGDPDKASVHYRRTLATAESQGDAIRQISALNQLGMPQGGLSYVEKAIEIIEREMGSGHPLLASPLVNLASGLAYDGRYAEALPLADRSHDLLVAIHGEDYPFLGFPLVLKGQVLIAMDRPELALEPLRQGVARIEGGLESSALSRDAHVALADALLLLDRLDNARGYLDRAAEAAGGRLAEDRSGLNMLRVLGNAHRRAGDLRAALESHRELLSGLEELRVADPDFAFRPLFAVARTLQAAGRHAEARPLFEEALESAHRSAHWVRARTGLSLAEIVIAEDPTRARRYAAAARAELSDELALHRKLLAELDAWQRRHRDEPVTSSG